jgi:uncharacterized protein
VGKKQVVRLPVSCVSADGQVAEPVARRLAAANMSPEADPTLYHMTVVITTQCNLACSYCFQNTEQADPGRSGPPPRIPRVALTAESRSAILDFGRRQMAERGADKLDLMLFGGEPTLHLDSCLRLLEGAQQLGLVSASMISNGTRLGAEAAVALERAGLRSVQITLDGDAPVHDTLRVTVGGGGTFERIIANLAEAGPRTSQLEWNLRVNLSADSIGTADALLDRLSERLDPRRFNLGFSLVNDAGIGFADALSPNAAMAERVSALYRRALDAGFGVHPPFIPECRACDAFGGRTGAVVNGDGTLYSCWESIGKEGYEVGTIGDGYLPDETIRPRWVSCGFSADHQPSASAARAYYDGVDAVILDWLHAAGRLGRPRAERVEQATA